MNTKVCSKCGKELPLSEFHKDKRSKDGLTSQCKDCVKQYHHEHKEEIAEYMKQWKKKNREHVLEYDKNYSKTQYGRASYLLCSYNREDEVHNRGKGNLTAQWIVENIFSKPCAHCGETDWHKLGCNRLDNSKPHTKDNVEPCCVDCNKKLGGEYNKSRYSKKVYQYSIDGKLIKVWESACECGRNGFDKQNISKCCRGVYGFKTHNGYKWSYNPL